MLLGARLEDEESDKDSRAVVGIIDTIRMHKSMTVNDRMMVLIEENKSTSRSPFVLDK